MQVSKILKLICLIENSSRARKQSSRSSRNTSRENIDDTASNLTMPEYLVDKIKSLKPELLIRIKEAIPVFKIIDEYYQDRINYNCRKFETHHIFKYQFYHDMLKEAKQNCNSELKYFHPELVKQISLIFEESKPK